MAAKYHLPTLSGVLIGTSYSPFPPWAALFCLAPLWCYWHRQSRLWPIVRSAWLTSFLFTLIGFNWVTYTLHEFAQVDWWLAAIGMVLFALFGHLFLPIAGCLWFYLARRRGVTGWPSWLLMAISTALAEWAIPMLFKWNFGYSWYGAGWPVYQWAELVGFTGLSALTIIANLAAVAIIRAGLTKRGTLYLATGLIAFALANLSGQLWVNRLKQPDAKAGVLMVQANIGNAEKVASEQGAGFRDHILTHYLHTTDSGLRQFQGQPIDFAVWPETAFPYLLGANFNDSELTQRLRTFLEERQLNLITGAYSVDSTQQKLTNSLFVIRATGEVAEPHHSKSILLALGEYLPGETWLPGLRTLLPMAGNFAEGSGPTLLAPISNLKLGPQICYESLFPAFSKGLADLGAQLIVNVTNDSWYGSWQEPYQHLYMTLARAVEFRRPVLRVTNTGISTVALASGRIMTQSPLQTTWAGYYAIPYQSAPEATFYQRHFHAMPIALGIVAIIALGAGQLRQRHRPT
ncbi:MAG: apolipoprotein N-acyltransferase [Methylococcales bacterium]|nr:apolipoprotein N-acyltransferase [Methylococcales bacterium]